MNIYSKKTPHKDIALSYSNNKTAIYVPTELALYKSKYICI